MIDMQGQPNLNCQQMEEALDAYYDLELSPEEAEAVELHLADCTSCSAKLADIEMVVSQLKSLPAVEWSGDLSDAIEARILAQSHAALGESASAQASAEASSKAKPEASNVVALNSGSNARAKSPAGGIKTGYILASAASILALFFAFSQFSSAPTAVNKVAQLPVKVVPAIKEAAPVKEIERNAAPDNGRELANANESTSVQNKPIKDTSTNSSSKVAVKPDSAAPKFVKEETPTEKMLASNKQGDRDTNKNNVNDSEEIVAVYDYETIDSASDFGINTNEDGLYAIKL